jgi:hypothetical protein
MSAKKVIISPHSPDEASFHFDSGAIQLPRIIAAIVDGTAPADLTVTSLAKTLLYSWCEQERSIRL